MPPDLYRSYEGIPHFLIPNIPRDPELLEKLARSMQSVMPEKRPGNKSIYFTTPNGTSTTSSRMMEEALREPLPKWEPYPYSEDEPTPDPEHTRTNR